jgi:penicillin amidase
MAIPGDYNQADRGQHLDDRFSDNPVEYNHNNSQALQLDPSSATRNAYLHPLVADLHAVAADAEETAQLEQLFSNV